MLEILQSPLTFILTALELVVIAFALYFSFVLLVQLYFVAKKSFSYIKRKTFQNLNNIVLKICVSVLLIGYLLSWIIYGEEILTVMVCCSVPILIITSMTNSFESLNESVQAVFNDNSKLWGTLECKVESRLLDRDIYELQAKKIKTELVKKTNSLEHSKKLDNELSYTLAIIDNIDGIFRKSLKKETMMEKNSGLLRKLYNELLDRYDYFEKQYHELLHENYDVKNNIAKTIIKNKNIEDQSNILKNL